MIPKSGRSENTVYYPDEGYQMCQLLKIMTAFRFAISERSDFKQFIVTPVVRTLTAIKGP